MVSIEYGGWVPGLHLVYVSACLLERICMHNSNPWFPLFPYFKGCRIAREKFMYDFHDIKTCSWLTVAVLKCIVSLLTCIYSWCLSSHLSCYMLSPYSSFMRLIPVVCLMCPSAYSPFTPYHPAFINNPHVLGSGNERYSFFIWSWILRPPLKWAQAESGNPELSKLGQRSQGSSDFWVWFSLA